MQRCISQCLVLSIPGGQTSFFFFTCAHLAFSVSSLIGSRRVPPRARAHFPQQRLLSIHDFRFQVLSSHVICNVREIAFVIRPKYDRNAVL